MQIFHTHKYHMLCNQKYLENAKGRKYDSELVCKLVQHVLDL
jgi:hypothetical protein